MVAVAYLQMPEGPLWTTIRGQGLAYGAHIGRNVNSGLMRFIVYRSPDAAKALAAAHAFVAKVASGEEPIPQIAVEGAISQVVSLYMEQSSTPASAGSMDFVWTAIRGMPSDIVTQHLAAVGKVTIDEVRSIISDLVLPLFKPETSNVVVTCGKKMSEGMETSFKEMGYETSVKPLAEFPYHYGLEGPVDGSDGSDGSDGESGSDSDSDGDSEGDELLDEEEAK